MELITYRITLDTNRNGVQRTLQGFETGDNLSRELRISLTDGKESYEIPLDNSVSAVMYVTTPSGVLCVNDCDIDGNEIVYKVLDTDTLEAGIVQMQIKLVSSSKVLVSPRFAMDVWESTVDDSEAIESPTFTALETALAEAQEAYNGRVTSVVLDDDNLFVVTYADGREYTSTAIQDALELIDSVEEYVEEAKESAETATDAKDVVEADKAIVESAKAVVVSAQASVTASKASVDASEANALSYKNDAYDYMESAHTYATEAMEAEGYAQTAESAKDSAVSAKDVAVASANTCTTASASASANKILAQSYAVGGTGTRAGEDTDNAKYYMEQASHIAQVDIATTETVGIVKPDGSTITIDTDGTISSVGGVSSVSVTPIVTSGTKIAEISVDGTTNELYAPNSGASSWDDLTGKPFESIGENLSVDADGKLNATGGTSTDITLTQAEYDALPSSKLTDGVNYFISDSAMFSANEIAYGDSNVASALDNGLVVHESHTVTLNASYNIASVPQKVGYKVVGCAIDFENSNLGAICQYMYRGNGEDQFQFRGWNKSFTPSDNTDLNGKTVTIDVYYLKV